MKKRLSAFLCATMVLAQIPSCEVCDDFWKRWRREPCGFQEMCLYGSRGGVQQNLKQNVLDCNGTAPDKDTFRCGNISRQITSLITKNCKYSKFDMETFLHQSDPAVVYLDYTEKEIIPIEVTFSKIRSLEMIFLKGSRTGGLFQIRFDSDNRIQTLEITNHDFSRFPKRSFANLRSLTRMEITIGPLRQLVNDFFSGLRRLKELSLFSNKISDIQLLAFKDLVSLQYLDLSNNRLTAIRESTFQAMINLEELDLSYNPLRQLPQELPFGSSKMLSTITLAYCNLTELPNIDWSMHNLASVDLTGNSITRAVLPVYTRNRTNVNLNSNSIKIIELNFTQISNISPVYSIYYNEPICDCELESFLEFLHSSHQKQRVMFPGMDVVMCAAPNSTKTVVSVWPHHIFCAKRCPQKCSCIKLTENTTAVNCSDRGLYRAPTTLPPITVTVYLQNNNISTISTVNPLSWHSITSLYLSNNQMKTLSDWINLPNLKTLALDGNHLKELSEPIMEAVDRSKDFRIYLAKNQWTCNCTSFATISWMQKSKEKIVDYETLTCERYDEGEWSTPQISDIQMELHCPTDISYTTSYPFAMSSTPGPGIDNILICSLVSVLAVLLLCLLFCLLLHRRSLLAKLYGKMLQTGELEEDKGFDVFVCYNNADRRIANAIVGRLEPQYRVFLHDRDLLSPEESSKKILYTMRESKAIILIISTSFIRSRWFQVEFRKIYRKIPDRNKRRLIPIFLEDVNSEKCLPRGFRQLWYLKSRLRWDENFFWEKLLYLIRD